MDGLGLDELADGLRGAGYDPTVAPAGAGQPPQLLVDVEHGPPGQHLALMLLPGMDDPQILQCYAGFPTLAEPAAFDTLCRFLVRVNGALPIGGLGLLEGGQTVYYRFNDPLGSDEPDWALLSWKLSMASYIVTRLGPLVGEVAGGLGLAEAVGRLVTLLEGLTIEESTAHEG
jgi:hypothetical protein